MVHRFCTACGSPLPAAAAFCPACGQRVETGATPAAPADARDSAPDDADAGYVPLVEPVPAPLPEPRRETLAPAAAAADDAPPSFSPEPPPEPVVAPEPARGSNWPLWAALLLIAGALGFGAWWTLLRDAEQHARFADDTEQAAPTAPVAATPVAPPTDVFLSDAVTLHTSGPANVRDGASADGTAVLSALAADAVVTGRWVRGRDGQSRWLRLDNGGYVWDGNLIDPAQLGAPIRLTVSNKGCDWGADYSALLNRLIARRDGARDVAEGDSLYQPVTPARPWRGLTVTAVALHYEASSIIFREAPDRVAATLRDAGVSVARDGTIPGPEDQAESQSVGPAEGEGARYGRTQLTCGV